MKRIASFCVLAALATSVVWAVAPVATRTVGWRTDGTGMYPASNPPLTWSTTENVVYRQPMPDWSNATPAIFGDRMYFCAEKDTLICADVKTGKILWQRANPTEGKPLPTHKVNGYTSPTPITNGKIVCVVFGSGVAAVYDTEGAKLWARPIQQPKHQWGHCASPRLVGDTLIVSIMDVFGLDAKTGAERWRAASKAHWGSPAVTKIGDVDVVITPNGEVIRVDNGAVLASKLATLPWTSPVVVDGIAYFIEKGGKAIRLPKQISDDMTFEVLWTTNPHKDRHYASPIVRNGLIFVVTRGGEYEVIDATNGEVVAKRKLDFPKGTVYPSPFLAGGRLYISHDSGTTLVLAPTAEYTELARNTLEPFRSTPVCVGDRIYIRGFKNLYCIGE